MLAVERHRSAEQINAVINDPTVRPWVANGKETLDLTVAVANENNILLMAEHGGCMFYPLQQGIYEVHTQVRKAGRGEWLRELTDACAHWMFTYTPCYEIVTRVPFGHIAARAAAVSAGMKHEFTRPKECLFRHQLVDVAIYSYRLQDWAAEAPMLTEIGRAFHEFLHHEAARLHVFDEAHPDDENHNRYVGAAIAMILHGQHLKGVRFYNRWAAVSRHEQVKVLSISPLTVQIDHGLVLTLNGSKLEVTRP